MGTGQKFIALYESKKNELEVYLKELEKIIEESGGLLEETCFYYHQTLELYPDLFHKQVNLFVCGQQAKKNV